MPEQRSSRFSGESLLPEERLRRRADFRRCYERGHRLHGRWVSLYFLERGPESTHTRVGLTVTRRVGGAVVRQKVKRRMREIYRRWDQRRELPAYDIVMHAKPGARSADFIRLSAEIHHLLEPLIRRRSRDG